MSYPRATVAALLVAWFSSVARAQDLPRGTIVDEGKCGDDASQSYALYLPST